MEWIIIGAVGIAAIVLGFALFAGALALLPITCGMAFVGWLIGGSSGALVGVIISGVLGLIALRN